MTTPERRAILLDRLADHVLEHGLAAASLRPLARAAGTSDRMLIYYFADKDALIAATLEHVAVRLAPRLAAATAPAPLSPDALRARLAHVVLDAALWPFMRLWLEIASRAAHGDAVYRTVGGEIARGFLTWIEAQLDSPVAARDAAHLLATIEGIVLLKSLGLDDACAMAAGTG